MSYPVHCDNDTCPENHRCHRFMAEPGENQVYQKFKWRTHVEKQFVQGTRRQKTILVTVFGCAAFYSMPSKVINTGDII